MRAVTPVVMGHTAATLAMFGLMWCVQIVVYPQFHSVEPASFAQYVTDHSNRIVLALAVLAPAEIGFAAWLWLDPPTGIGRTSAFIAGLLLAIGWIATALWFAPLHGKLQTGFDAARIQQLITTNWIRTGLWTARAGFALWFLTRAS